jgi:uncharacterized protein
MLPYYGLGKGMVGSKNYAPSKYNHFFKEGGKYLATNLLTNAVLSLTEDQHRLVRNLLEFQVVPSNSYERSIYSILLESKFIIPQEFDETAYLKQLFTNNILCSKGFSLGLIVTLACNFRCVYCYQEHLPIRMERNVQLSILALLEKKLPGKEEFEVSWFGGEPLLEPAIIERFGTEIIQLCDSLNIKYSASMATNGYLLDKDNINLLAKGRVNHVQITLDGPRQFHNKRRILANGRETYDVILENLYRLTQTLPDIGITIRMNISRGITKWQQWEQLLTDIAPIKDSITIYFDQVVPTRFSTKFCLSHKAFYMFYQNFMETLQQQRFQVAFDRRIPGIAFCGAIPVDNWMVSPQGYLSKCVAHVDNVEKSLGKLNPDGTIALNSDAAAWLNFSPFSLDKCKKCNVLPLCMGGCLIMPFGASFGDRCFARKSVLAIIEDEITKTQRRV